MAAILRSSSTIALVAGLGVGHAMAQSDGTVIELNVSADAAGSGTGASGSGNTSAGSKTTTTLKDVPQAVTVVDRTALDDHAVRSVDESTRYTAGVVSQPYGADSDTDWFYIRGVQATQTGVFLDGLPLYGFAFAGYQIDPYLLDRVEVIKGPASVLYGGSNVGGIVSETSKRPTGSPAHEVETGINSFGNAFLAFDYDDLASDTVSYRMVGKVSGGGWETERAEDLRGFLAPSVTVTPDENTTLTIAGLFSKTDLTHTAGSFLPYNGSVVDAPYGRIPRGLYSAEPEFDRYDKTQAMLSYDLEHRFDSGVTFSQKARIQGLSLDENAPYFYDFNTADDTLYRVGFQHQTNSSQFAIDNQLKVDTTTGAIDHHLLGGIDYKSFTIDQVQSTFGVSELDPLDPVYGLPVGPFYAPYIDESRTLQQLGLYGQDQMRFGDGWLVTLNGRYDVVNQTRDDRTAADFDYSSREGAFSGRFGLAYEFDNGVTPYLNISHAFNPVIGTGGPTGTTIFAPEIGDLQEVGVKFEPEGFDGVFTASLFQLTRSNVVVPTVANPFVSEQLGEVTTRGLELEANVHLSEDLSMIGAVTLSDMRITADDNPALIGNQPNLLPSTTASLWLSYAIPAEQLKGLSVAAGVRFQGESFADRENTLKVPAATVFDAAVKYEKDDWSVALNVNNIFDTTYVSGCETINTCSYGEGRKVTVSAKYKW